MPQFSVMAHRIVLFEVPGGPSRSRSRPAVIAASTRSSSRLRPTTLADSAARRDARVGSGAAVLPSGRTSGVPPIFWQKPASTGSVTPVM